MSLGPIPTGAPSRAPLSIAALRDRLEDMEMSVQRLMANRQSIGPQQNQQDVALHHLSNAQAMGAVGDGQSPVFDGAIGQFSPGGPLFRFGPALAGDTPPPGPFVWSINGASYEAASAGGNIRVPFLNQNGAPVPFQRGLLGIVVCVGNASPSLVACGIATAGYALDAVTVDFFATNGPVADGTDCVCDYTAYGW